MEEQMNRGWSNYDNLLHGLKVIFKKNLIKSIICKTIFLVTLFILIIFLRLFVFEFYQVESCSMEETLFAGDVILVSKLQYGAKLPMQPKDVPFLEALAYVTGFRSWCGEARWAYRRISGISGIKRGDIIVFTHTQKAEFLIKRCTGLPGDTFLIAHSQRFVNNIRQPEPATARFSFTVRTKMDNLPDDTLNRYGISKKNLIWNKDNYSHFALTYTEARAIKNCTLVDFVVINDYPKGSYDLSLFPSIALHYTLENYRPFIIPAKNKTIAIDTANIIFYQDAIVLYEKNDLKVFKGEVYINNNETTSYTFKMNYYCYDGR